MRMQPKKITIAASCLIVSGSIYAAPPTPYDNWVIDDGVIYSGEKDDGWLGNTPTPAGGFVPPEAVPGGVPTYTEPTTPPGMTLSCDNPEITCKVIVQDAGFIYEQITYPSPNAWNGVKEYLRLIVVDEADAAAGVSKTSAEVSFSSESFIPFSISERGNDSEFDQGIAVKQVVRDTQDNFVDIAVIQKHALRLDPDFFPFAANPPTANEDRFTTDLTQTFNVPGEIDSVFKYKNYTDFEFGPVDRNPDKNDIIGQQVDISQGIILGDNPTTIDPDNKKKQVFEYRQRSGIRGTSALPARWGGETAYFDGEYLTTPGSITLETYAQTDPDNNYDGSTVGWLNGQDIRVTWIAATDLVQFVPDDPENPMEVGFAYQQVVNATTGAQARERFMNFVEGAPTWTTDPVEPDPFDWNPNFDPEPSF